MMAHDTDTESGEAAARTIVRDWMSHLGYQIAEIDQGELAPDHSDCDLTDSGWFCLDEDEKHRHPTHRAMDEVAELVMFVLEHPAAAEAVGSSVAEITATPPMPWLELARRNQAARLTYVGLAEDCWRTHDYLAAIRYRGVAEGLEMAQQHQAEVIADRDVASNGGEA
jgi:hypothetical protein